MKPTWMVQMAVAWMMLLATIPCVGSSNRDIVLLTELQQTVNEVRNGENANIRRAAAYHLAQLTSRIAPRDVSDKTLSDLISLVDSPEDSVRAGVAAALGYLGSRAKPAVPKLLELLPKVDCLQGAVTSADAIRLALTRIGVTPPPRPDCGRIGG